MEFDPEKARREEIAFCRNRLIKLGKTENGGQGVAPLYKGPPRISVGLTDHAEFEEIQELARRCNTSVSALGHLAFKHLLNQSRAGVLPLLPAETQ